MLKRAAATVVAALSWSVAAQAAEPAIATVYQKNGTFADVRQDAADEIVKRGFVIDYTARIGDMLARTAKDVGAQKPIYASAEAMQFCPAKLSSDMIHADPTTIVAMWASASMATLALGEE